MIRSKFPTLRKKAPRCKMRIKTIKSIGSWRGVADSARTTVGKEEGPNNEPSSRWKKRMLLAEHSPIRQLIYRWKWADILSWVSVHITRHKIGIDHFVTTQRTDRTGKNRDIEPQGTLVSHECLGNAQAIINISRRRLCKQASKETQDAWKTFLKELWPVNPELVSVCVPDCVYRGTCYEMTSCGYHKTKAYEEQLGAYRTGLIS
jgi:hypothetical protein